MTYIEPVIPLLLLLLASSCLMLRHSTRPVRFAVGLAFIVLFLWSWPPITKLTFRTLEFPYSSAVPDSGAGAIVVLSAGALAPPFPGTRPLLGPSSYARIRHAVWLHRNWKPLPVLASGGPLGGDEHVVLADEMRGVMIAEGVPENLAWVENRSLSTYENALYCARILKERGIRSIVLVTEGYHMLRAEMAFRKQGLEVTAAPCTLTSRAPITDWTFLVPDAAAVKANEDCLHEWIGLIYYWLTGKI